MDRPTFQRFADAWQLHDEPTDDGHLATQTYTFDGMNWETGGKAPIVYVMLHVVFVPHGRRSGVHARSQNVRDSALRLETG